MFARDRHHWKWHPIGRGWRWQSCIALLLRVWLEKSDKKHPAWALKWLSSCQCHRRQSKGMRAAHGFAKVFCSLLPVKLHPLPHQTICKSWANTHCCINAAKSDSFRDHFSQHISTHDPISSLSKLNHSHMPTVKLLRIKSSIAIPRMYLAKRQTQSFVNNPPIKLYSAYQYLVKLNRQRTCKPNSLFQTKYVSAKPNSTWLLSVHSSKHIRFT